ERGPERKGGRSVGARFNDDAVATDLMRTPVEDDQLAVEVVHRAETKVAVAEQLGDRHHAVITTAHQVVEDRCLGDPAATGRPRDRRRRWERGPIREQKNRYGNAQCREQQNRDTNARESLVNIPTEHESDSYSSRGNNRPPRTALRSRSTVSRPIRFGRPTPVVWTRALTRCSWA